MSRKSVALPILLAGALSAACSAVPLGPAEGGSDGFDEVTVGLTAWFPDIDSAVRAGGNKAIHSQSISDSMTMDELAANGRIEMWEGDEGYIIDAQYIDTGSSITVPGGRISTHTRDETIDFLVAERFLVSEDSEEAPASRATLMWGMRVRHNDARLTDSTGNRFSETDNWIEPVVGAQLELPSSEDVAFVLRGDASGFNLGSGSRLTWNAFAGGEFALDVSNMITIGWRVYDIDYNRHSGNSESGLDGRYSGPSLSWIFAY